MELIQINCPTMFCLVLALVFASCVSGQLHSVCHSNAMQLTEQQVITQVADLMDRNHNNIVTSPEIVLGFRDILGVELNVSDFLILTMDEAALLDLAALFGFELLKEDFVSGWVARFHDSREFVEATFDAFDTNHDGVLHMGEVEGILNLMRTTSDADRNGVITRAEFTHFFTYIYSC